MIIGSVVHNLTWYRRIYLYFLTTDTYYLIALNQLQPLTAYRTLTYHMLFRMMQKLQCARVQM
jgi:thiaminase